MKWLLKFSSCFISVNVSIIKVSAVFLLCKTCTLQRQKYGKSCSTVPNSLYLKLQKAVVTVLSLFMFNSWFSFKRRYLRTPRIKNAETDCFQSIPLLPSQKLCSEGRSLLLSLCSCLLCMESNASAAKTSLLMARFYMEARILEKTGSCSCTNPACEKGYPCYSQVTL